MKCISFMPILVPIDGVPRHVDSGEEFECDEQTGKYLISAGRAEEVKEKPALVKTKKAAD